MNKFDVAYNKDRNIEKELVDWKGKVVKRASVIHNGADGYLNIEFENEKMKK